MSVAGWTPGGDRRTPRSASDLCRLRATTNVPMNLPAGVDHEAWGAALGTAVGYLLVLAAMFLILFVLPYLAFAGT